MEIVKICDDIRFENNIKSALCLGTFDGMHLGHRKLAKKTVKIAKEKKLIPCAAVFELPNASERIISFEKKCRLLEETGIKKVYLFELTESFRQTAPEEFVKKFLLEKLNAEEIICGFNYTFGKNKQGTTETLNNLSEKYNFSLTVINPVKTGDTVVSSTEIRGMLKEGNVKKANRLLGYIFNFSGDVQEGNHIGRTLDFRTANVYFDDNSVALKKGVYASETVVDGIKYKSITNLGNAPTFGEKKYLSETHIIDFKDNIYGKNITVYLHDFLREEKKFNSPGELVDTIKNDVKNAESVR